jgi:hypothetical protein
MMTFPKRLEFSGFHITIDDEWEEITDSLDNKDNPITIARSKKGVGVLQISQAIYRSGPKPLSSLEDLKSMLAEFSVQHGLGEPFDSSLFSDTVFGIGSSFHSGEDFIRAWYLSDGKSFILITYVCNWNKRFEESQLCENIVRSVCLSNNI